MDIRKTLEKYKEKKTRYYELLMQLPFKPDNSDYNKLNDPVYREIWLKAEEAEKEMLAVARTFIESFPV